MTTLPTAPPFDRNLYPNLPRTADGAFVSIDNRKTWLVVPTARGFDTEKVSRVAGTILATFGTLFCGSAIYFTVCSSLAAIPFFLVGGALLAGGIVLLVKKCYKDPAVLARYRLDALNNNTPFSELLQQHSLRDCLKFLTHLEVRTKLSAEWRSLSTIKEFYEKNYDVEGCWRQGIILDDEIGVLRQHLNQLDPQWQGYLHRKQTLDKEYNYRRDQLLSERSSSLHEARMDFESSTPVVASKLVGVAGHTYAAMQDRREESGRRRAQYAAVGTIGAEIALLPAVISERQRQQEKEQEAHARYRESLSDLGYVHSQRNREIESEIDRAWGPNNQIFIQMIHNLLTPFNDWRVDDTSVSGNATAH